MSQTASYVLRNAPLADHEEPHETETLAGIIACLEQLQERLDEIDGEHERQRYPLVYEFDNLMSRRAEMTAGTSDEGNDLEQMLRPDDHAAD